MKGVIVAAGYGTRFLPVTKTIPKEMLPLVNKPSIQFIVEEFIQSGIKDIIIITSRRKNMLDNFFDREIELESVFTKEGKQDKLNLIAPLDARFSFVRQTEMKGTGHALLQVKELIGSDSCVVAYPDDLHLGTTPLSKQLIDTYNKTGCSVMASFHEKGDVSRYGVLELDSDNLHVKGIVEKPNKGREPSHEVSIGRYLYTSEFFSLLEKGYANHTGGEYYHIFALNELMKQGKVVFKTIEGLRLDTGEPEGYIDAFLRYATTVPEWKKVIENFAKNELGLK